MGASPAPEAQESQQKQGDPAPAAKQEPKGFLEFVESDVTARAAARQQQTQQEPQKQGEAAQQKQGEQKPDQKQGEQKPDGNQGGESFLERWLKERVPDAPNGIAKIEDWKSQRDVLKKALTDLQTVSLENEMLKKSGVKTDQKPGDGAQALPETEAVKKLSLELETLRKSYDTDLAEFKASKAKADLSGNQAFRAEFDGKRAAILDSMKSIVSEAGLDEQLVETLINAGSEFKVAKALEDLQDPTAKSLLIDKAKSFLDLTKQKDAALANPIEELKKWNDYAESLNGVVASRITDQLRGAYINAVGEALEAPEIKDDIFFSTPGGRSVFEQISQRFSRGLDLTPREVVTKMALAEAAPVYRAMAEKQAAEIARLTNELARYARQDPGQMHQQSAPGGSAKSGFDPGAVWR